MSANTRQQQEITSQRPGAEALFPHSGPKMILHAFLKCNKDFEFRVSVGPQVVSQSTMIKENSLRELLLSVLERRTQCC